MAIVDLKLREGNVDIVVEVIEKDEPREFEKFGRPGKVCNAKVKDDSGEMKLTLWNDQIDLVNVGDKIHIINGYVNEWQGEPQLTTGRFGKIEKVE
jgi:replication factor A1